MADWGHPPQCHDAWKAGHYCLHGKQHLWRDTAWAMSEEHVQAFKRTFEAGTRFDFEAVLEELHPRVEWHPLLATELEAEATVYRGHERVREWLRELEEAFAEAHMEFPEVRDLGDRIVAIGRLRTRGRESGAETVTPIAYVVDYKDGKAIRVRSYLDPEEALEAAGLRE